MENLPAFKNENNENVRPSDFIEPAISSKNNLKTRVATPLKGNTGKEMALTHTLSVPLRLY